MLLNAVRPSYQNKVNLLGPEQTVANLWSVLVRDPITSFTDLVDSTLISNIKAQLHFFLHFWTHIKLKEFSTPIANETRKILQDLCSWWRRGLPCICWDTCRYSLEPGSCRLSLHSPCRALPAGCTSSRALAFKGEQCWTHLGTAGKKGAATSPALPWAFQTPQQLLSRAQSLGLEELPVSAPKHRVSREGWEGNLFRLTLGSFLVCLLLRFSSVGYSSFLPTHWH